MERRKNRHFSIILTLIGLGIFFFLWRNETNSTLLGPDDFISPLAGVMKSKKVAKDTTEFLSQLKQLISTEKGSYSIYIYDLNSDTDFGLNETAIFTGASVNKIFILASLYHEANEGKLDLDTDITIQSKDIQDYGTGIIRNQGAGQVYSLKTLAQLMIEKSDNTAAYVLTTVLGENRIQELVTQWGLIQTDIANNKTSNKDVASMLLKMYRGQITDKAHTSEMIGFMDDSDFENRLPKHLPKNVPIYHKIGTEVGNIHDVGIVVDPKKTYFIGVMTNDISDETAAETLIAEISKRTYDFMTQ